MMDTTLVVGGSGILRSVLDSHAHADPRVESSCKDFLFTHVTATRDFGYRPIVPFDRAQAKTMAGLRHSDWAQHA